MRLQLTAERRGSRCVQSQAASHNTSPSTPRSLGVKGHKAQAIGVGAEAGLTLCTSLRGGTHVPGFWSWKGLRETVLTLMIADEERLTVMMGGGREESEG